MAALRWRVRITASVDKQLYERLKKVSDKSLIPISKLLDLGIEHVLGIYEDKEKHQDG